MIQLNPMRHFYSFEILLDYDCKRQGCWIKDPYVRGRDVGVYDDTGADCAACQDRCNSDPKCGAVECNGEYCYWWAHGRCINSSSSHFFTFNQEQYKFGYTCYKRGNEILYVS